MRDPLPLIRFAYGFWHLASLYSSRLIEIGLNTLQTPYSVFFHFSPRIAAFLTTFKSIFSYGNIHRLCQVIRPKIKLFPDIYRVVIFFSKIFLHKTICLNLPSNVHSNPYICFWVHRRRYSYFYFNKIPIQCVEFSLWDKSQRKELLHENWTLNRSM